MKKGLRTQAMLDRSMQQYLSGELEGESAEIHNFGNFIPYVQSVPRLIEELSGIHIKEVAAGYSYSIAVAEDGRVFSW